MSRIAIAAPVRPAARSGNHVTAARWARHLEALGHLVSIIPVGTDIDDEHRLLNDNVVERADILFALHASRSASVVERWVAQDPARPLVVALTGTDLYVDMPDSVRAMTTVDRADRLIVLQAAALDRLANMRERWPAKSSVVHQSVDPAMRRDRCRPERQFRVIVLAHLRSIKDPLMAARAVRHLAEDSTIGVHHGGYALDDSWASQARGEQRRNGRYHWYGELDPSQSMELLATGHVLACTSKQEGGANVITEAIAMGIPVVGTKIDGNVGLLGVDYPGLVPVGDDQALATLLRRLETDPADLDELQRQTDALRGLADPATERAALAAVLHSL